MNALVIELSTARASLALFRDSVCVSDVSWDQVEMPATHLYTAWSDLLRIEDVSPRDIDRWICGRGPGRFSSLRVAITAASVGAMAAGSDVYCISSAEGLARDVMATEDVDAVAVLGDARRGTVWIGQFLRCGRGARLDERGWRLVPASSTQDQIPRGAVAVSPDLDRLRDRLPAAVFDAGTWIAEARCPTARQVGAAALDRIDRGEPGEEAAPLYLHPPVAGPVRGGQA